MGLWDRTLGGLRNEAKSDTNVALAMMTPAGVAAFPNIKYDTYVQQGYQKNELVFACIEEWSTDIAEPEIAVFHMGPDGPERVQGHEALPLFTNPNPWMSGDDFTAGIQMYKRIAGNAYEYKVRSRGNKVVERWLLRPDRVTIVPNAQKHIDHYEYRIGAAKYDIDPKDIVHHRTRNPYDDFYGFPPLMAASGRVDIDNHMKDMVKGVIQNSGVPAGILQVAGKLTDQEKALARARFRNDFGGTNAGNIIISDGGRDAPSYTPLGQPLGTRGLIVPELDEMDEARICMVFRVPLSLAGARLAQLHNTLGNAGKDADRKFFTEQELVPEWALMASVQTMGYGPDLLQDGEWLEYDLSTVRSLTENEDSKSSRILAQHAAPIRSVQESRRSLGWNPDPKDDDIFMVPVNVRPMTWAEIKKLAEMDQQAAPPSQSGLQDNLNPQLNPHMAQPQRLAGEAKTIVVNVLPGETRRVIEYDDDGNMIAIGPASVASLE